MAGGRSSFNFLLMVFLPVIQQETLNDRERIICVQVAVIALEPDKEPSTQDPNIIVAFDPRIYPLDIARKLKPRRDGIVIEGFQTKFGIKRVADDGPVFQVVGLDKGVRADPHTVIGPAGYDAAAANT